MTMIKEILNMDRSVVDALKDSVVYPISNLIMAPMDSITLHELMTAIFLQHQPDTKIDDLCCFFRDSEKDLIGKTFKFKDSFLWLGISLMDLIKYLNESGEIDQLVLFNISKHNE